ncbi:MAG: hypothetical protein ABTR27_06795 [Candidatus Competibacter phosphatis]|uniref:hypothetical protein n=1 Tax=Accumulibacter sp. TaxID=2053492 RepID=UPI002CBCB245|nr:hypothetical protein [Accumulibacter sp.]HRF06912.1 hypothetical protein [Accumulibacter sp.]
MEVLLPGGLPVNGRLERHARFRPLTGRIEQAVIESSDVADRPAYVTSVLCRALDSIGAGPADEASVARLGVADRQYLILRLGALLGGEQLWLKLRCAACDAWFDVDLRRNELPVRAAAEGYPWISLQLGARHIEAVVPNGEDQQAIAALDDAAAMQRLLRRCIRRVDGAAPGEEFFARLSEADIEALDEALDDLAPAVCDRLQVDCPECHHSQQAPLDHYAQLGIDEYVFYDEVHTLASHYHWSEADILDLPRSKRQRYLDLISRSAALRGG